MNALDQLLSGPARRRVILIFAGVLALESADLSAVGAAAPELRRAMHLSNTQLGLLAATSTGVGALVTLPAGLLADRVRRVPLLALAALLWAAAMVASASAHGYEWLLVSRLGLGALTAAAGPLVASLTGDFFPPAERGRIYGYVLSGELIGAGAGFLLSGAAASTLSWRWAFAVLAAPALALAVCIWRLLPEPTRGGQSYLSPGARREPSRAQRGASAARGLARRAVVEQDVEPVADRVLGEQVGLWGAVGYVLKIPTIRWLIAASTVGYFFFAGLRTFALAYVRADFGLGQAAATGLLLLFGVGSLAAVLSSGRLTDRLLAHGQLTARLTVPGVCYVVAALCLLPGLTLGSAVVAAPTLLLAGAALSAPNPPLDAARLDVVPSGLWGRAEGVRTLVRQSAQALAPLAFGALADALGGGAVGSSHPLTRAAASGLRYAFLITLAALVLNGLALLAARHRYPPDVACEDARPMSNRWFSAQPNVPGQGLVAAYSARFWGLIVALGLATGILASALMGLLRLSEHLAYGYRKGPYLDGLQVGPGWRHVVVLLVAAVIVAAGLRGLGRLPPGGGREVSEALWLRRARLGFVPSLARGVLSIVTVGMGVSLGREAGPQLAGAATASRLADWADLPLWQRRLLVAAGAGAGFAAVYNVPLGGTLLALEVMLGSLALPLVLPVLMTAVISTAVGWITLGTGPTYHVPSYSLSPSHLLWAALAGPLIGLAAVAWSRMIAWAHGLRPPAGWPRLAAPVVVFAGLGLLSIPYPQLLGNGKNVVQLAVVGGMSVGLLAVLSALKPLATVACLGSGSPGGLFTPTFTVGVLLAGVAGAGWSQLWPGHPLGSYALIGGGAFLAAAMQGPIAGTVLVLELTRNVDALMVPTLVAVAEATVVARRLGAQSIYSARLPRDGQGVVGIASAASLATVLALDEALPEEATRPSRLQTREVSRKG
jgi:chloride channel protein, CIC family